MEQGICDELKKERNHRRYLRRKAMWPSHLARTGHRWKAAKDNHGDYTGLCVVCGEVRVIRAHLYR